MIGECFSGLINQAGVDVVDEGFPVLLRVLQLLH